MIKMMDLRRILPITHHRDQAKLDISEMEKIKPADSKVVARIPLRNGFLVICHFRLNLTRKSI